MKKLIGLMLAVIMLAALASTAIAENQGTEMYVYTRNGLPLFDIVRQELLAVVSTNLLEIEFDEDIIDCSGDR